MERLLHTGDIKNLWKILNYLQAKYADYFADSGLYMHFGIDDDGEKHVWIFNDDLKLDITLEFSMRPSDMDMIRNKIDEFFTKLKT